MVWLIFIAEGLLAVGIGWLVVRAERRAMAARLSELTASRDKTREVLSNARGESENLRAECSELRGKVASLLVIQDQLLEPPHVDECSKVRLRDRDEAIAFAARVENEVPECGELEPYRCKICPRQPVNSNHFWHIAHKKRALRNREYNPTTRPVTPTQIFRRVTPEDVAALRRRLKSGDG